MTDDSDESISLVGSWKNKKGETAYKGRCRLAKKPGASVSFDFSGTQFTLISARGPKNGQASVHADGKLVTTLDQ